MSNYIVRLTKYAAIGLAVGMLFNIIWAVVFWEDDQLFIFHWLAAPISILIVVIGARPFGKSRDE
jgi:uncharacterized membrane protein YphA (DoxX/SURF4 family)